MNGIIRFLIYLYFILFPLGVFISYDLKLLEFEVTLVPVDLIAFLGVVTVFVKDKKQIINIVKIFAPLIYGVFISYGIKFQNPYNLSAEFIGLLYFARLLIYLIFPAVVFQIIKTAKDKTRILLILFGESVVTALIGLFQYKYFPDLRTLKYLRWDDHLNRLVSSYLDPTFTGLILTFGLLIGIYLITIKAAKLRLLTIPLAILLIALLLTYSRSSYLAFMAGIVFLFVRPSFRKYLGIAVFVFVLFMMALPKGEGYGVILTRTHSIYAKAADFAVGTQIFGENPVFGTGYNNLCWEKLRWGSFESQSHSCFGLDFSPIMLLTTFGVAGTILLITSVKKYKELLDEKSSYKRLFYAILIAVSVHSLFSNTLFYPWVMGYVGIFLALVIKKSGIKINRK
jgi:hypothetical protein